MAFTWVTHVIALDMASEPCSVPGCTRPYRCKGYCHLHYQRWRKTGDPGPAELLVLPWPDNLLKRLLPQPDGCIWHDSVPNGEGYAVISRDDRQLKAHRAMWELMNGPIPDGMTLDHTCHDPSLCDLKGECPHRRCVNVEHLEVVDAVENVSRGGSFSSVNAAKTHCKRGHEFTPENTGRSGKGRYCKICRAMTSAANSRGESINGGRLGWAT